MKYSVFIFAALVLLESGRIRDPVPYYLEHAHSAHIKIIIFISNEKSFK